MKTSGALLAGVPYFVGLDERGAERLGRQVGERKYRTGELILEEGGDCRGLYFVMTGQVKMYKTSLEGKEQVLRILGPGRTFNDVSVFDGGPNPASVAALENSTVGFIPTDAVLSVVAQEPQVSAAVIRTLASRLRALTELVEDLSLRGVTARVAKLLLDCARGHHTMAEGAPTACDRLTQQQLAAMTGSVREVVQRSLKTLERDGAIRLERARVVVLNLKVLERWTE
jgi:CRP/FNR family transcriptional regulator